MVRTLAQRGLVAEVGRDPGPGQAALYGTTPLFLERLGLDWLADLPPLGEFVPGAEVVEALEDGLRRARTPPSGESEPGRRRRRAAVGGLSPRWRPASRAGAPAPATGSGCRRSWPGLGFGSRRVVEELIEPGRVTVNGRPAVLGARVDADADEVAVDGVPVGVRPVSSTTCSTSPPGW